MRTRNHDKVAALVEALTAGDATAILGLFDLLLDGEDDRIKDLEEILDLSAECLLSTDEKFEYDVRSPFIYRVRRLFIRELLIAKDSRYANKHFLVSEILKKRDPVGCPPVVQEVFEYDGSSGGSFMQTHSGD